MFGRFFRRLFERRASPATAAAAAARAEESGAVTSDTVLSEEQLRAHQRAVLSALSASGARFACGAHASLIERCVAALCRAVEADDAAAEALRALPVELVERVVAALAEGGALTPDLLVRCLDAGECSEVTFGRFPFLTNEQLTRMLGHVSTLVRLEIRNGHWITSDAVRLVPPEKLATLQSLDLEGCGRLDEAGILHLLEHAPSLTSLSLAPLLTPAILEAVSVRAASDSLLLFLPLVLFFFGLW